MSPHPAAARRRPAADAPRRAVAVDPATKEANRNRLRRIEGQVRGLQKMVEDDRYCPDILVQISAVHEALRTVGRSLLRNHLKHCATHAIVHGTPQKAERTYDELLRLIYRHSR
jgi:DNA-binding FrmR family transcriptional regulator